MEIVSPEILQKWLVMQDHEIDLQEVLDMDLILDNRHVNAQ